MRALILRRAAICKAEWVANHSGAGRNGDVLRLQGFLRNTTPTNTTSCTHNFRQPRLQHPHGLPAYCACYHFNVGDQKSYLVLPFLRRNGQPQQFLNPETDAPAKALIERFHIDPGQLPIVLCPSGQILRNPGEDQLARCLGLVRPIDPDRIYDVAVVGAGPAGLATAVYAASEGLSVVVLRFPRLWRSSRSIG